MGKCVVLVGGTCSGKTLLAKTLEQIGFKRMITYTTRKPRKGEVRGKDYHFISEESFNKKKDKGFFAETTIYHNSDLTETYYYGSAKKDYNPEEKTVVILNPQGALNTPIEAHIVWLKLDRDILANRAKERGWSRNKFEARFNEDTLYFEELKNVKRRTFSFTDVIPHMVMASMIGQMVQEENRNE